MSYKAEVIAGNSNQWVSNQLRFATASEAAAYVHDLAWRWTAVQETRVQPSEDPVNYMWRDGRAEPMES